MGAGVDGLIARRGQAMMNAGRDAAPGRRMCFFQAWPSGALLNSVEGKPMIGTEAGGSSRREFLGSAGKTARRRPWRGWRSRRCMPARATRSSLPWWAAAAAAPAAATNALSTKNGPIKLVAMADVFENRLQDELRRSDGKQRRRQERLGRSASRRIGILRPRLDFSARPTVHRVRRLQGKPMDCLRPGDVVLLAAPCAFRWVHFSHAIDKGLNVFMEKPITVDGPSTRKMLALANRSARKNLKVGVGLMCGQYDAQGPVKQHIRDGQIGEITYLKTYRLVGPRGVYRAETGGRP